MIKRTGRNGMYGELTEVELALLYTLTKSMVNLQLHTVSADNLVAEVHKRCEEADSASLDEAVKKLKLSNKKETRKGATFYEFSKERVADAIAEYEFFSYEMPSSKFETVGLLAVGTSAVVVASIIFGLGRLPPGWGLLLAYYVLAVGVSLILHMGRPWFRLYKSISSGFVKPGPLPAQYFNPNLPAIFWGLFLEAWALVFFTFVALEILHVFFPSMPIP